MDTKKFLKAISNKIKMNITIYEGEAFFVLNDSWIKIKNTGLVNGIYNLVKGEFQLIEETTDKGILEINKHFKPENITSTITVNEDTAKKIVLASKFCGTDDLRPVMTRVFINKTVVVATDAHFLYKKEHGQIIKGEFGTKDGFLIDSIYAKFFKGGERLTLTNDKTIIETDELILVNSNGLYPNFDTVIPSLNSYTKCATMSKEKVKELLKTAEKLQPNKNNIFFKDNNIIIPNDSGYVMNEHKEEFILQDVEEFEEFDFLLMPVHSDGYERGLNAKLLNAIALNYSEIKIYFNENPNKAMLIKGINKKTSSSPVKKKTTLPDPIIQKLKDENAKLLLQIQELKTEINTLVIEVKPKPIEIEKLCSAEKLEKMITEGTQKYFGLGEQIIVVDYSEKALALFGDATKNNKGYIQEVLKGRFNPYLKNEQGEKQCGWIISKKYSDKLSGLDCKFI